MDGELPLLSCSKECVFLVFEKTLDGIKGRIWLGPDVRGIMCEVDNAVCALSQHLEHVEIEARSS